MVLAENQLVLFDSVQNKSEKSYSSI